MGGRGKSEGDSMGGGFQMRITIWLFKKVFAVLRVDIFPGGGSEGVFCDFRFKGGWGKGGVAGGYFQKKSDLFYQLVIFR